MSGNAPRKIVLQSLAKIHGCAMWVVSKGATRRGRTLNTQTPEHRVLAIPKIDLTDKLGS
jgi:hypothetical protein